MAIVKDCFRLPSHCEVEITIKLVSDESIKFEINFQAGSAFPKMGTQIACLNEDFIKLLNDLQQLDRTQLSILELKDPGLCIYHIPEYGTYFDPEYGIYQVPEQQRNVSEPLYNLIFVLDASYKNHLRATGCGAGLCLKVKMQQINEFVDSLKADVNSFEV